MLIIICLSVLSYIKATLIVLELGTVSSYEGRLLFMSLVNLLQELWDNYKCLGTNVTSTNVWE